MMKPMEHYTALLVSPWSMGYTATAAAMLQFSPLIRLKVSGALNTIQFVFNLEDSQDSE